MRIRLIAAFTAIFCGLSCLADAHVIPADVTVRIFVKPDGDHLRYLVRMPMASVNDIDWPINKEDGTLNLTAAEPALRDAATQWLADYTDAYEDGAKLAYPALVSVRLSLEGDAAFGSYESALGHVMGPRLAADTKLLATQGMLDALFDYPIHSAQAHFSIHPRLDRLGLKVTTMLQFLPSQGSPRTFEYEGGDVGVVHLDPLWTQAVSQFAQLGFFNVLDATELLLLLFCLILPFRRGIIPSVVAFGVGQTIALLVSAYGLAPRALWFMPLVGTLVAASIFWLALDGIVGPRLERRPAMAYTCGVIYGFAMALVLEKGLQFGGSHGLTSIVSFAAGSVIGEIFTLLVMALAIELVFQFVFEEKIGMIVLSAIAAHAAWLWIA